MSRLAQSVRFVSHLAVWTCVSVPAVLVLRRGWTPLGDYAGIELRAYRSLSFHPPLVGMYSTAGAGVGHTVFDPGPLALWLLALPVHVDPARGLVWGSVLLWGLVLSLAIEALWATGRWLGCAFVALALIDLLFVAPSVLENLAWNAYLPLPFLFAGTALAFVVANGGLGWWPALVATGSVAAQTHLFYVLPALGLVVVAPLLGLFAVQGRRSFRWLGVGVGVTVVCWTAPIIQAFGAKSNLAALARGTGGAPTLGFGFAFRLLGNSAGARPLWLSRLPNGFYPDMAFTFDHSAAYGVGVLSLIVMVTLFAARTKRRALLATSALTAVISTTFLVSFAGIPVANLIVVDYLLVVVWVEGLLIWLLGGWCLWLMLRWLFESYRVPVATSGAAVLGCGVALLGLVAGGTTLAIDASIDASARFGTNWSPQEADQVTRIVAVVEHTTPRGLVTVALDGAGISRFRIAAIGEGVGLQLLLDGWRPGLSGINPAASALPALPHAGRVSFALSGQAVYLTSATSG